MKTKITILGSCISRNVFNPYFVPNYKEFFEVAFDVQRTSLISLMQDPVVFDKNSPDILPQTQKIILALNS